MPIAIKEKMREYQDMCEASPDKFIFFEQPALLDESREAVEKLIHAPADTVVFVSNATEAVNTVFRNIKWNEDGKDVIVFFSTVYPACAKVADFTLDYFGPDRVGIKEIPLNYPLEDEEIIQLFRDAVADIQKEGKRARICTFDVVSSNPGLVFPWVEMCKVCKELDVLSMVDGAQGLGMVPLDIAAADPDFFTSNAHKWLHVPRGCAIFYCPLRNQPLIPSTLATSHGYEPKLTTRKNPLPPTTKSRFVANFEFVGTKDRSPDLATKDAIAWRRDVCGGEDRIMNYIWDLNKKGAKYVAEQLGTEVLENKKGTLTNCGMANIALPVWVGEKGAGAGENDMVMTQEEAGRAFNWVMATLKDEYRTRVPCFVFMGRLWVRFSAQIYLDMRDYEHGAKALKELVARMAKGEHNK